MVWLDWIVYANILHKNNNRVKFTLYSPSCSPPATIIANRIPSGASVNQIAVKNGGPRTKYVKCGCCREKIARAKKKKTDTHPNWHPMDRPILFKCMHTVCVQFRNWWWPWWERSAHCTYNNIRPKTKANALTHTNFVLSEGEFTIYIRFWQHGRKIN